MEKATKTPNGDSKRLTPEQAEERMRQTDACNVLIANQRDVSREAPTKIELIGATIEEPKRIEKGGKPENKGDSINPTCAAVLGSEVTTIINGMEGKAERVPESTENETQKAAREKHELSQRAAEKYERNQAIEQEEKEKQSEEER